MRLTNKKKFISLFLILLEILIFSLNNFKQKSNTSIYQTKMFHDENEKKIQAIQSIWFGHASFVKPSSQLGYITKQHKGITFVKLNGLNDLGSNANIVCPSVIRDFSAVTTQEKGVRGITSINSRTEAQMSHITLLNIDDEYKVKVLKPFLVNISCFF